MEPDTGTSTFEAGADLALLEEIDADLGDVEHALRRIDAGSYGICEACGRALEDSWLQARPTARFCPDHQP